MTIAELHGKLSSASPQSITDRMEDLLTSDVFGTMRYAGVNCGFLDWIHTATPMPLAADLPPIRDLVPAQDLHGVLLAFWPKLPNHREPDVILLFSYDGTAVLIVVEAKYQSGMSDFDSPAGSDGLLITGNQIIDQVKGLADASTNDVKRWFEAAIVENIEERIHLLVTAHSIMPDRVYTEATKTLCVPWPVKAYWLSWTTLAAFLREPLRHDEIGGAAMIKDLSDLLRRKSLVAYRGFSQPPLSQFTQRPLFWREGWWQSPIFNVPGIRNFWEN